MWSLSNSPATSCHVIQCKTLVDPHDRSYYWCVSSHSIARSCQAGGVLTATLVLVANSNKEQAARPGLAVG